jgi:hypothetical protein
VPAFSIEEVRAFVDPQRRAESAAPPSPAT